VHVNQQPSADLCIKHDKHLNADLMIIFTSIYVILLVLNERKVGRKLIYSPILHTCICLHAYAYMLICLYIARQVLRSRHRLLVPVAIDLG